MVNPLLAALLLVSGFLLGALVTGLWWRARIVELDAARKMAETSLAAAQAGPAKMAETFQALADAALRNSQQSFLQTARATLDTVRAEMTGDMAKRQTAVETTVKPLNDSLVKLERQIHELEAARRQAYGSLDQQMQSMALREVELQKETASLVTALRAPQVRGRWGEITLRRVAELAGMAEHCDFGEQETTETETGRIRPDMTVRLPGERTIIVDAKAPLTAYLDAVGANSEGDRRNALLRHSQQVAKHVDQLSSKAYWAQFQPTPEFVVLFLPGDPFFAAALENKPALVEDAARLKVLIATPTTLIAILKGVAYGWRQEKLAENAEEIRQLAAELFDRIVTLQTHFNDIGRSLGKSVDAFNRCVGSLESRVYPSLRRIRELGATTAEEPPEPERVDMRPRTLGLFESS